MKRIHMILQGRVQGVCFRAYVQKHASALGLKGWVKNVEPDKVEVVAQGAEENLDILAKQCKKGPLLSRVDDIKIKKEKERDEFKDFRIVY